MTAMASLRWREPNPRGLSLVDVQRVTLMERLAHSGFVGVPQRVFDEHEDRTKPYSCPVRARPRAGRVATYVCVNCGTLHVFDHLERELELGGER